MPQPSVQRTLVLLKPDTVRRGLVGEVLSRFEAKGLSIVAMEHRTIEASNADEHYAPSPTPLGARSSPARARRGDGQGAVGAVSR